jgi:hypothetical protein
VVAAEAGADHWRAAVHAQRPARPAHSDFYAIAAELVATLRALSSLTGVLADQVAGYGAGRVLRDDAGANPTARLAAAAALLGLARRDLDRAERASNEFWSQISHIATEEVTR